MRSIAVFLALVLAAPMAAQDRPPLRRTLGADSLFGPGLVDQSVNGSAVKLRLIRPAHVAVFALREPAVAQLVLPQRSESRMSRVGDQWIDLPWRVSGGPIVETGRVVIVRAPGGLPMAGRSRAAAPPAAVSASGAPPGGSVTLVIVADSAWSRDAIAALLPREPQGSPMEMARAIAAALLGSRTDTCAAYLVRW